MPGFGMRCVVHQTGQVGAGLQLLVPQVLDVVGTVAAGRTGDAIAFHVHPRVGISVQQVALLVGVVTQALVDAEDDGGIDVAQEAAVARVAE